MSEGSPSYVEGCEFCAIARGEAAATVVYDAATWLAFFPLNPATPGHTLVIPRAHVTDLWQVQSSLGADLMDAVIQVGRSIQSALAPEGMNLITSAGATAEQSVFHLHLHLVPRWRRDGFGHIWPVDEKFDDAEFTDVATRVRNACVAEIGDR